MPPARHLRAAWVAGVCLFVVASAAYPAVAVYSWRPSTSAKFLYFCFAALESELPASPPEGAICTAVATTTLQYTDESGNTGATGTFPALVGFQAPATPVIGTFMPFSLAAGDRGVRALTNASGGGITLATTYTSGTMSALAYRPLVTIANNVSNVPAVVSIPSPGIRLYPGTCIAFLQMGSASASTLAGSYTIVER